MAVDGRRVQIGTRKRQMNIMPELQLFLIIPFTRRLPYYIYSLILAKSLHHPSITHHSGRKNRTGGEGEGEFLLVVPKEMILVLADLNRASTILHHHSSLANNQQTIPQEISPGESRRGRRASPRSPSSCLLYRIHLGPRPGPWPQTTSRRSTRGGRFRMRSWRRL